MARESHGPGRDWAKWREARDKRLANPKRNPGAKRMAARAAAAKKQP